MPDLVAIDLPQTDQLTRAIADAWERGDAVSVLDPRWGTHTKSQALAALAPTILIVADGVHHLESGQETVEGDALVVLSSGSVADPKAAVLTMDAVRASAIATTKALEVDPHRHTWLCCLPCSHIGGLSVIARALLTATPLHVIERPERTMLEAEARSGVTHVSLVNAALQRIDPSWFELILLGGSAPPHERPPNVVATYGMTETGSGVVYDGVALDEVTVAIDQPDAHGVGEILIDSPTVLRAYRDRPASFVAGPDRSGRWLATGDLGRLDPEGLLEVRGRAAEVIVTGGEKIYPTDVEPVIAALPGVREVAVWKRPDPMWGDRVVAWIVPDASAPSLDAVRGAVRNALGSAAAPKEIVVVDALPRTQIGKIQRRRLS